MTHSISPNINQRVSQTPRQLILRDEAAEKDPRFASIEGRALEDVRRTIGYIAARMRPNTVLGGLIVSSMSTIDLYPYDSTLAEGNGRDGVQVAALSDLTIRPNENGDTVSDILEGLVSLGFVERDSEPEGTEIPGLFPTPIFSMANGTTYKLATDGYPEPLAAEVSKVQHEVDNAHAEYQAEAEKRQQRTAKKASRKSIFRRNKSK